MSHFVPLSWENFAVCSIRSQLLTRLRCVIKLGPITEVGYNALHTRLGIAMTNTQALTESRRPAGSNNLFVAWETLTHAENTS